MSAERLTAVPTWLVHALGEFGHREVAGASHNPRIVEYHAATTLKATTDEVPWCSSLVQWCVAQSGFDGTCSAAARSWLQWGRAITEPRLGCIAVFRRGLPPSGHVAFFVARRDGRIYVLGGNQGNAVTIAPFRDADLIGFRWPNSLPLPPL